VNRADDQVITDEPYVFVLRKTAVESSQDRLEFGLSPAQALGSLFGCAG
jgi:hypothetical protein